MVLVPLKDKVKIYTYFLQEGVFACKKDNTNKNETFVIPYFHCFLIMRSLISRKLLQEYLDGYDIIISLLQKE